MTTGVGGSFRLPPRQEPACLECLKAFTVVQKECLPAHPRKIMLFTGYFYFIKKGQGYRKRDVSSHR